MSESILQGLNPSQTQAAGVTSGPLLILAGAGSGKTRVLTYRLAYLISMGVPAEQILAVTFTNKAAKEMQERVQKLLAEQNLNAYAMPTMGTFHSLCVRMLREDIEKLPGTYLKNFVIFDTDDAQKLIKLILQEEQINEKEFKPKPIANVISGAKNQLVSPDRLIEVMGKNRFTEVVNHVYPIYQKRLMEHNALDFDDLLQKTVEVLERCPEVLEKYRNRWQQVMVDEYQDTNFAQYRMIRLLTEEHENLGVVGDDHQSIYSFRGADFRNILDFEKDFPHAVVVKLEQNYRSSGKILANANHLISHNRTGRKKNLWTENDSGNELTVKEIWDEKEEGNYIAESIQSLIKNGEKNYGDIAILYRMNAQSRAIEEALMRNQIPYKIIGGTRFFDRKEIKDVMAYLRLIFNPRDDIAFLRVINVPARKLGPATLEVVKRYANEYQISLFEVLEHVEDISELSASKIQVLKMFYDQLTELRDKYSQDPISILLQHLLDSTDYLRWLDDGTKDGETRQQNVRELFSVASRYDTSDESLADFLEGVALISDMDNADLADQSVTLMTVHASKGLEFPVVFLPGWEEGMFPSTASQTDNSLLEEERRLGYVAITRAEQKATITHAKQRMLFGRTEYSPASQFISELHPESHKHERLERSPSPSRRVNGPTYSHPLVDKKPANLGDKAKNSLGDILKPKSKEEAIFGRAKNDTRYTTGDKVRHAQWGEGTVIQVQGGNLKIAFKGEGMKTLVADIAPIEKI